MFSVVEGEALVAIWFVLNDGVNFFNFKSSTYTVISAPPDSGREPNLDVLDMLD